MENANNRILKIFPYINIVGDIEWRNQFDKLHRDDGPAYEGRNGTIGWYRNNILHRLIGPAIETVDGHKEWWVSGRRKSDDY